MSKNLFNSVKLPKVVKATHNMSYRNLLSCNLGKVLPFYGEDCLPSDVWKCNSNMFVRLAPLALPSYANLEVFAAYFKVPRRLIEPTFDYFITGGRNGQAVVASTCITLQAYLAAAGLNSFSTAPGSLADLLGYPSSAGSLDKSNIVSDADVDIDLYRAYAYQIVMDDYFTDENLDTPYVTLNNDGTRKSLKEFIDDGSWPTLFTLRSGCYRKDSFLSSALPFAQRGPAVSVGGELPLFDVVSDSVSLSSDPDTEYPILFGAHTGTADDDRYIIAGGSHTSAVSVRDAASIHGTASSSDVFSFSLEDLRKAVKLQRFFETNARGGSRLIEQCLAHFGVRPKDGRVQRPEMIGGGKFEINISEVLQTSKTDGTSALGSYAGKGIANSSSPFGKTFCDEHCYIIGVLLVRPRLVTFEGLSKHLQRSDRFDYPFPEFEGLGEQEIKVSEVNIFTPKDSDNKSQLNNTFGFAPRYHEFKSHPQEIHGTFRTSLRAWHMGRTFGANLPVLNKSFMEVPQDYSIFAVSNPDVEHFYFCIDNRVIMNRPLHKYSTPSGLV